MAEEIKVENNTVDIDDRRITLCVFPAFEGFELNRRYRTDYRLNSDSNVRAAYALDVLSHAEYNGKRLDSVTTVNAVCETWQNLETVFHAVLKFNGVDLELSEEKARWFDKAGAELAITFIAEATRLMVPFMKTIEEEGGVQSG
jgi:hypothetical protein